MSNIDKQALLGADKHANQHRLSRLIIEANSAELRAIAEAVEQYTDQLIAALEAEEKHIAELESKNSNLQTIAHEQNELAIKANLDSINDAVEMDSLQKRIAELEAREIKPSKGEVLVTVSGFTGCGKSAIAGEIEIAMKAIGVPVQWTNGDAEKRMMGADWLTAIEMYRPTVRIVEVNVPRAAGIKVKG